MPELFSIFGQKKNGKLNALPYVFANFEIDQFSVCLCEYHFSFKDYPFSSFQVVLFISGVVERASKELSRRFTSFTSRSRKVSKHEKLEEHSLLTVSNIWNNTSKTNKNTHRTQTEPFFTSIACFQHFSQIHPLLYFLFGKVLRAASDMLTPQLNQNSQQITVRNVLLHDLAFSLLVVWCKLVGLIKKGALTILLFWLLLYTCFPFCPFVLTLIENEWMNSSCEYSFHFPLKKIENSIIGCFDFNH